MSGQRALRPGQITAESDTNTHDVDGVPHKFVYIGLPNAPLDAPVHALRAAIEIENHRFTKDPEGEDPVDRVLANSRKILEFLRGEEGA